jgi:hypothetical protein
MDKSAAGAASPADPQVVALVDGVIDERVAVALALVRFEATLVKSDMMADDDSSTGAKRTRDKTMAEEARLTTTRDKLTVARAALAAYGVAISGASAPTVGGVASAKADDEDAVETKGQRLLKRKLPSPKDDRNDPKGVIILSLPIDSCFYNSFSISFESCG